MMSRSEPCYSLGDVTVGHVNMPCPDKAVIEKEIDALHKRLHAKRGTLKGSILIVAPSLIAAQFRGMPVLFAGVTWPMKDGSIILVGADPGATFRELLLHEVAHALYGMSGKGAAEFEDAAAGERTKEEQEAVDAIQGTEPLPKDHPFSLAH